MYTLHVISLNFTGNPCSIPAKSNSLQILQRKSECGYFKITGIAGIHTIPMNLKSLHSDFPAESLQFPANRQRTDKLLFVYAIITHENV